MLNVVEYTDARKEAFKTLNYEWLEKYFKVEPVDVLLLSKPKEEIIDKGGQVFFAEYNGDIVGTAALIPLGDNTFELGKMAVTEKYRGLGIGKKLIEHCLQFSKLNGVKKLILYSNRKLHSAIHLYEKYGFTEATVEPGHYERADIKMERLIQ